ncbi:MAG TPA: ubiquinone/menaquinone biosynthesis methyltransferase [Candidatus Binatia bacterium]|jgi:demethylmenaquinone methyltransferase/2-methoxy-6-polyprenyl-1,4-benzoquinol methylase
MATLDKPRDPTIQAMFDRIAARYDILNRIISFRLDNTWRSQAIKEVLRNDHPLILDLGAGTGDLTFAAAKQIKGSGRIIGLDFSREMLKLARSKQTKTKNGAKTCFIQGSATFSPFKDATFDGVMTAFVLRNVSDLSLFFFHAFRVLKSGGRFVSLDMFPPGQTWFSSLYALYFYRLVPWIGGLLAHDHSAYRYLAKSVEHFHPPEYIAQLLQEAGFRDVNITRFLNGAVCMHAAEKPRASY